MTLLFEVFIFPLPDAGLRKGKQKTGVGGPVASDIAPNSSVWPSCPRSKLRRWGKIGFCFEPLRGLGTIQHQRNPKIRRDNRIELRFNWFTELNRREAEVCK
ncbi:hypothetical protein RRG08_012636 [Elysia crispata]|uniref:Uncharacterized protein n=1 Tax=Elysia crispata TaxID=231223 RepID=A0AAE1B683_9GAST|nr:hypothetical protein RRG08_012636 [Elysia crispata]